MASGVRSGREHSACHRGSDLPTIPFVSPNCRNFLARLLPLIGMTVAVSPASEDRPPPERSYWLHASLGLFTQKNYFGTGYPATIPPTGEEIRNAAEWLAGDGGANRLYLIFHREIPDEEALRVFRDWREATPETVELIPALVTRMYDAEGTPVFSAGELEAFVVRLRGALPSASIAIYDIAAKRDHTPFAGILTNHYHGGLVRLGLQPGEALAPPFRSAAQDTWSALCHGADTERDWRRPGFGAETLRKWVAERNGGEAPVAWNLITVAWDYSATERGGFPGYDDAEKNDPLPADRNRAAVDLIRSVAEERAFAGFSSDLCILHENSRSVPHDGREGSFYECLKRGEDYPGFYAVPLREITAIYREIRDGKRADMSRPERVRILTGQCNMRLFTNGSPERWLKGSKPKPTASHAGAQ